jgi:hypothetical protein
MKPIGCDRPGRPCRFLSPCSEQGKLPAAKAFRLAERDKDMSEPKTFMQQLDDWSNAIVIVPLTRACNSGDEQQYHEAALNVEKAIREKVLESYRNGQAAGPRKSTPRR